MRYPVLVAFAALVIFSSFGISGWALDDRFHQGAKTRVAICQQINVVKQILHDEHRRKLDRTTRYLKAHPNGIPGIPRELILQGIADERRIVASTTPDKCK